MNADGEVTAGMQLLALAVLANRVKEEQAPLRVLVGRDFAPGEKRTFRSPVDDLKLGQIWRTDPNPSWTVTDREALHAFLAADPDNVETVYEPALEGDALVEALKEAAPDLLVALDRVTDAAVKAAVERAKNGEAIPGVEKKTPEGSLTVRADPQASDAIAGLIGANRLSWDGRRVLEQKNEEAS